MILVCGWHSVSLQRTHLRCHLRAHIYSYLLS